jgi:hypothetical protein
MIRVLRTVAVAVLAVVGMALGVGTAAAVDPQAPYAMAAFSAGDPGDCDRCGYPERMDYPIADEDGDFVEMATRCPHCGLVESNS